MFPDVFSKFFQRNSASKVFLLSKLSPVKLQTFENFVKLNENAF